MKNEFRFDIPIPPDVASFTIDILGSKVIIPARFASDEKFMECFMEDFKEPPPADIAAALRQCTIVVIHHLADGKIIVQGDPPPTP